jgi:hypothetical protein
LSNIEWGVSLSNIDIVVKEDLAAASRPSISRHAAGRKGLSPILLLFFILFLEVAFFILHSTTANDDDRRRRDIYMTVVVTAAMLLRLLRHDATSGFMANSDRICLGHSRHGTVRCRNSAGRAALASLVLSYRFVRGHPCQASTKQLPSRLCQYRRCRPPTMACSVRLIEFAAVTLFHDDGGNVEYGLARPQAATTVPCASLSTT